MAGTWRSPIVRSAGPPGVAPAGVRTSRARVAGASPCALLVICAVTLIAWPQAVWSGETPSEVPISCDGWWGVIVTTDVS